MPKQRLLTNPLENIEAARAIHFEIEKNQAGHGIERTIRVLAIACQVIDGRFPAAKRDERQMNARLLPGALKKKTIVLAIIDVQNACWICAVHKSYVLTVSPFPDFRYKGKVFPPLCK